jgi:hypothetical protein
MIGALVCDAEARWVNVDADASAPNRADDELAIEAFRDFLERPEVA